MKILLLRPLPDPRRWSMDLYSREISKALKAALGPADEVILFPSDEEAHKWTVSGSGFWAKIKRWWQQYFLYGWASAAIQADVYHITDHGYAHILPYLKNKKTVVTFHDALLPRLGQKKLPISWFPRTAIWAQNICLKQLACAQRVVSVSEFSKNELLEFCALESSCIVPIYHGLDPVFLVSAATESNKLRREWGLEKKKVLLLTGRSDPHKNVEGTLRVYSKMLKNFNLSDVVLLKIGDHLTESQKQLAGELGIRDYILEKVGVPFSQIPAIYQMSDVVLFLSWYEGFGLPIIESMASGVPILISNRGSLPEISGGHAAIVDPADEEKAADVLGRLLTDIKFRSSFIDNGKDWAFRYQWGKTAKQLIGIYEGLS